MYILKCDAFTGEPSVRYTNKCCEGHCHEENLLINVTPFAIDATRENRRLDWEMGIQGMVCCGRYEFVRSLSREWWVNKGAEIGLWTRDKALSLMHTGSWHRSFDDRRTSAGRDDEAGAKPTGVSAATLKKVKSGLGKCPACGSKWSGEVCDNCGHGAGI